MNVTVRATSLLLLNLYFILIYLNFIFLFGGIKDRFVLEQCDISQLEHTETVNDEENMRCYTIQV